MLGAMPVYDTSVGDWLATASGQDFQQAEREAAAVELGRMFGAQFLQVGTWGEPEGFLTFPGAARRAICHRQPGPGVSFVGRPENMPVAGQTVDGLLLPHTLELTRHPHEVLREAERVLAGGGRIMVLGFNPISVLGVRRFLTRGGFPPGLTQFVTERRLRDWMSLLGFDVTVSRRYFPALSGGGPARDGIRKLPFAYGAYLLVAIKRVRVVTPLRKLWRNPAKVATPGLVEPSTRNRL
jgi:SAM-dependent methyltransferase